MTQSPTSPIRADRAGLGGGRAPTDLPTCQSCAGHPHACLLSDPISVCQTAGNRRPGRRGGGWWWGGGDLIRINYASPHRPAVLLIHERDERKVGREGSVRRRRAFKTQSRAFFRSFQSDVSSLPDNHFSSLADSPFSLSLSRTPLSKVCFLQP